MAYPENLSPNLSFKEATASQTAKRHGIANLPNQRQLESLKAFAEHIHEPLRAGLGDRPIFYWAIFRCPELNTLVPGADPNSQHQCLGDWAAGDADHDLNDDSPTNREMFDYVVKYLDFDQIIWEFGTTEEPDWVHISYRNKGVNRKRVTRSYKKHGKTVYTNFDLYAV